MSLAMTPTSTINRLFIEVQAQLSHSATVRIIGSLIQDSTADALTAVEATAQATTELLQHHILYQMRAGTVSATTFAYRAGGTTGATTTFNGKSGARIFGGIMDSYMRMEEIFT